MQKVNERILGFDLARAYAIFGMYIVNFIFCFGSFRNETFIGKISNLFIGNSTSIFIICAGMGVVFLSNRYNESPEEKSKLKSILLKRSLFLLALGLALFNWWPGDILHFYAGYMHLAAFILFIPKRNYIWIAFAFLVVYHILQQFIPITTSWNLQTTQYADFWTPIGFIRNTFYNGWNSIFPWFAYFSIGMYLGRLDWNEQKLVQKSFVTGMILLLIFKSIRLFILYDFDNPLRHDFYIQNWFLIMEDYFPVNIPFFMITTGWALMVIATCMYLSTRISNSGFINLLAKTGKMTLSLYVMHMTLGAWLFMKIFNRAYTGYLTTEAPIATEYILLYALVLFVFSVLFSYFWNKKFEAGPLELLMRKLSN